METTYRHTGLFMLALIGLVFLGFYKTYWSQFPNFNADIDVLIHFHALMAVLWVALLIVQPLLIRNRNYPLHRQLGKFTYMLFPVLILSFLPLIYRIYQRGLWEILLAAISALILLVTFYSAAIFYRKNTPLHMRFMIATALVFIDPTLARIVIFLLNLSPPMGSHIPFVVTDIILLALIYFDWKNKRNFKPYIVAISGFVSYQLAWYIFFFRAV